MLSCFTTDQEGSLPLHLVAADAYEAWQAARPERAWLLASGFKPKAGRHLLLPTAEGGLAGVLAIAGSPAEPWDVAFLPAKLPAGRYRLERGGALAPDLAVLGWALGSHRFERYRKPEPRGALLLLPEGDAVERAQVVAEAVCHARDLVDTPASDLGPEELAGAFEELAGRAGARFEVTVGERLLDASYPAIFAVGRASSRPPRLVDLVWGEADAPKLTLVGKGVCFDTGGLDIKPSANMLLMKKDMGGAAVVLGLAEAITRRRLPLRLRILVPAVENSIAGDAFRPGDVLRTRKGLTVEVGNTDAEGRLVLADALAEADGESPALLIDVATLTGAARVALGPDLPAMFSSDDALAEELLAAGRDAFDPLWRLPLHAPYRKLLDSRIADISNTGSSGFGGALTAALFLQEFVSVTKAWAHLDVFAHNPEARPGRPKGGEASALRALFTLIERRFAGEGR